MLVENTQQQMCRREQKVSKNIVREFGCDTATTILGPGFQNLLNRLGENINWNETKEIVYRDLQYFFGKLKLVQASHEKSPLKNPIESPFWVFTDIQMLCKSWELCEEFQTMIEHDAYVDVKADYLALLLRIEGVEQKLLINSKFIDSSIIKESSKLGKDWLRDNNAKILETLDNIWDHLFKCQMTAQRELNTFLKGCETVTKISGKHALCKNQVIMGIIDGQPGTLVKSDRKTHLKTKDNGWKRVKKCSFEITNGLRWMN